MSKFSLDFRCANAAFDDDLAGEISRILRDVADQVDAGNSLGIVNPIYDSNGNRVGSFMLQGRGVKATIRRTTSSSH